MKRDPTGSPSQPGSPRAQYGQANRRSPLEQAGLSSTAGQAHSGCCCKLSWCSAETHIKSDSNPHGAQITDTLLQIHLTLTAEQAILQVTEDSSFRVLRSKGTKSTRDRGLPAEQQDRQIRQPLNTIKAFYKSALGQATVHQPVALCTLASQVCML